MKIYHLPGLIFVLIFGLSVANFDLILQINEKYFFKYHLILEEIPYFKSIISEITFLIRSVFFLLLGYSLTFEMDNFSSLFIILIILFLIFLIRFVLLKLMKLPAKYYVWIAPRGLITVVLFFSIPYHLRINFLNDTIIVLTILSTT
jgi:NhaP-type Na+/H+ or K+/H+ antiporter